MYCTPACGRRHRARHGATRPQARRWKLNELYPAGRKHCAKCGHWRLLINFGWHPDMDRRARGILSPYCHTCRARYFREYRQRDHVRESTRIYAEAKRRESGARRIGRSRRTPQGHGERLKLPAGPFADWLRERVPDIEPTRWARLHDIDETHVRHLLDGDQETVHIDVVDRVLLNTDTFLFDLYPSLYEPEDAAPVAA